MSGQFRCAGKERNLVFQPQREDILTVRLKHLTALCYLKDVFKRSSLYTMSAEPETWDVLPDTKGILSVIQKLEQIACKDKVLLSNLDFSERVFRHSPLNKVMTLQVKGQQQCLRIGKGNSVIYTVSSEDGYTRIDCCVNCNADVIMDADIKNIHFSVHSCQNRIRSCFTEAKNAVMSDLQALKITCNKFSMTYTTSGAQIPDNIRMIETKCQFNLCNMTAEGLLEIKCWMENEKANCYELIACLDYLIEQYLTTSKVPVNNCRFILQGNKEMAEIISVLPNNQCKTYIMLRRKHSQVSVYPPLE